MKRIGIVIVLLCCAGLLGIAEAAATDLVEASDNLWGPVSLLTSVMELACYTIGAAFCIGAVMQYRIHRQNPKLTPLMTPFVMAIVGVGLLLLPYFTNKPAESFSAVEQSKRKNAAVSALVREYQREQDAAEGQQGQTQETPADAQTPVTQQQKDEAAYW